MTNDEEQFDALDLPLADIRVPSLMIHGTADASVPVGHALFLADRVPQAQVHVIEGANHMVPVSNQEAVVRAVSDVLDGLDDACSAASRERGQ